MFSTPNRSVCRGNARRHPNRRRRRHANALRHLQDAQLDFSADLKELYGQGRYAIALAPGKTKVEIKAKFAGIRGAAFKRFYFGAATTPATQVLFADSEPGTVALAASR